MGQIFVVLDEYWGVVCVVYDFVWDFGRVMGINYIVSNGEVGVVLIMYMYNFINNKNNIFVSCQNSLGNEGLIY